MEPFKYVPMPVDLKWIDFLSVYLLWAYGLEINIFFVTAMVLLYVGFYIRQYIRLDRLMLLI